MKQGNLIGSLVTCVLICTYGFTGNGLCQNGLIIYKNVPPGDAKYFRETVLTALEVKFTSSERKRYTLIKHKIGQLKSENDFFIYVEVQNMDDDRLSVKVSVNYHINNSSLLRTEFFGTNEISACDNWAKQTTEDIYYFVEGNGKERKKIAILDFELDEKKSSYVDIRVKDLKRKIPRNLQVHLNMNNGTKFNLKSKFNFQTKQFYFSEYNLEDDEEGLLYGYYFIQDKKLIVIVELAFRSIRDCVMDSIVLKQTHQMYFDLGEEVMFNWENMCNILIDN